MIFTNNIYLKLASEEDAEFIINIRNNDKLNTYLSAVSSDIGMQIEWIQKYKQNELVGNDYYFIIVDKIYGKVGTVRLYDINYTLKEFNWGSWVLVENRPNYAALESMLLSYDFAFNELQLEICNFKVHTINEKAKNFYERFGSKVIGNDTIETFFQLNKKQYLSLKYSKYIDFFKGRA